MYKNLTVQQVSEKLARGEPVRLIDVREPQEHAVARIEGAGFLSAIGETIDTFLAAQRGMANVANMLGGIDAWSARVDRDVPRY